MVNGYKKGSKAELEIAHLLERETGHQWKRIGGIEKHKTTLLGDVRDMCKQNPCWYKTLFIDVKFRSSSQIPSWWQKVLDDVQGNDEPVLIWKIGSKKRQGQWNVRTLSGDMNIKTWITHIKDLWQENQKSA